MAEPEQRDNEELAAGDPGPDIPPEQWIPEVPLDQADYLDGDPPVRLDELKPTERKQAEKALAEKAAARTKLAPAGGMPERKQPPAGKPA